MDEEYDSFFGFTSDEVKKMLEYYGMSKKESELKDWYDGYLFGSEEIYNPWSVIKYISRGGIPQAYWVNTGKNEILEDLLKVATDDITERLYALLHGERIIARIDQNVVYSSLTEEPANIYSLLLVAGYLKAPKKELQADGSYLCEVSIPNREIAAVYKSEILSHFLQVGVITRNTANKIAESLYANDYKKLQNAVAEYMDKSISFYDGGTEGFYHGLMLGLIALMDNQYKIKSNRESGDGRYDICLIPREEKYPGIIMELKWKEKLSEAALVSLAEEKPTGETKPSVDYSPYDELIKKAANILKNGYSSQDKVDISPVFFYKQSGYETLGYIKKDLDNDGIDELIFGGTVNKDGTTIIYDIFTIQDGTDVHAVAGWERNTYYLCTDGTIANEGSSGAAYSNWTYFKYSNAKLDMKETVYTDDKVPGQKYYYATDVALKTEKPISEEQAKEIRGKYTYEKLQFTPFVN